MRDEGARRVSRGGVQVLIYVGGGCPSIRVTLLRRVPLLGMTGLLSHFALSLFALSLFALTCRYSG
jgi:hypothetical protein